MLLTSAYILNPTLKPNKPHPIEEDCQDAKLLFYHPEEFNINDKRSHVGISEGVVQFFGLFAETKGYMVINSQNYTHVMKEVEPDYWLNLIFFHRELFDQAEAELGSKAPTKFAQIEDSFYEAIISHCYSLYCFFHHSFDKLFKEKSREDTNVLLKDFFVTYAKEYVDSSNSIDYFPWNFNGFCYCPIDKKNFMRTQLFLNRIKEKFTFVKYTLLAYSNYMIFNDMPFPAAKILYTYLTGVTERRPKVKPKLFSYDSGIMNELRIKREKGLNANSSIPPAERKAELVPIDSEPFSPVFKFWQIETSDKNGFLLGPSAIVTGQSASVPAPVQNTYVYMPRIYIEGQSYRLCIYTVVGLIVCLILEDKEELLTDLKQLNKLSNHLKRKAIELCRILMQTIKRNEDLPDAYQYYYYNYVNNAIKISAKLANEELRRYELAVILNNLHECMNPNSRLGKDNTTLCAYKTKDYWIVTFKILDREICVLLSPMLSIEKVEEERLKFKQMYFNTIFVL